MYGGYVELHAKSFHSFGLGASHTHELLAQAVEHGYGCLALTDTNLCGALDFARQANGLGLKPITGGELTLSEGSRLTLLAKTREGYGNLSRLFTLANAADRKDPRLDPCLLPEHAGGLALLTGGRNGPLSALLQEGKAVEAKQLLYDYLDWFGSDSVYVELQQNFLQGDAKRNRDLATLAGRVGAPVAATNDVHYHVPERYRLQHALVAASHNTTIDQALRHIQPNHHLCMKPPGDMEELFRHCPEAIANTRRIAGMCEFDLSADLGYTLPEADVPEGYTPDGYLQQLCYEAAIRRYGSVTPRVGGAAAGGVPADRAAQPAGVPAAVPGDRADRAADHGGAGSVAAGDAAGGAAAGKRARLVGGAAGGLPDRHQPRGPAAVGPDAGAVHIGRHQPAAGHRPGLPEAAAGRADPAGAPALRAGLRRAGRSGVDLPAEGSAPGLGQGRWGCHGTSCRCCRASCSRRTRDRWRSR